MNKLNFSFVIPGKLAGMSRPGRKDRLENDLFFLGQKGIKAILSLTESPLDKNSIISKNISYTHIPVIDFQAPTISQIESCIMFIDKMILDENGAVAVHCYAGLGRTGTILACYLVKSGKSAKDSITEIRRLRPLSIQSESQIQVIFMYEKFYKNQKNNLKTYFHHSY